MITKHKNILVSLLLVLSLSHCKKFQPPTVESNNPNMGYASWYGGKFHGQKTASGQIYDQDIMTAAHRTAPFGTLVRVTNLDNGESTIVRINDRGPFVKGRIIDLSREAASRLRMLKTGTAKVSLEFLSQKSQEHIHTAAYMIQAGSYQNRENATFQLKELKAKLPALDAQIVEKGQLYKVYVGPYSSEKKAQTALGKLNTFSFDGIVLQISI